MGPGPFAPSACPWALGPGPMALGPWALGPGLGPFAKLLNEFVSQRSYFLLASLSYLMNLFLGGAMSSLMTCQSSVRLGHPKEETFFKICTYILTNSLIS